MADRNQVNELLTAFNYRVARASPFGLQIGGLHPLTTARPCVLQLSVEKSVYERGFDV